MRIRQRPNRTRFGVCSRWAEGCENYKTLQLHRSHWQTKLQLAEYIKRDNIKSAKFLVPMKWSIFGISCTPWLFLFDVLYVMHYKACLTHYFMSDIVFNSHWPL